MVAARDRRVPAQGDGQGQDPESRLNKLQESAKSLRFVRCSEKGILSATERIYGRTWHSIFFTFSFMRGMQMRHDSMMAVNVNSSGSFGVPHERQLFTSKDLGFRGEFDVSSDGKHFLMVHREPGSWPVELDVVLNCLQDPPHTKALN